MEEFQIRIGGCRNHSVRVQLLIGIYGTEVSILHTKQGSKTKKLV